MHLTRRAYFFLDPPEEMVEAGGESVVITGDVEA